MFVRVRSLLAGLVAVALVCTATVASAQSRADLRDARDQIDVLAEELDDKLARQEDAELALDEATKTLSEIEAVVNSVGQRVEVQRQAVVRAQDRLDELAAQEEAARAVLRRKAVQLYMGGDTSSSVLNFMTADSLEEAIASSEFLQLTDADDKAVLDNLTRAQRESQAAARVLEARQQAYEELLAEQDEIMGKAEQLRERRALAAAVAEEEAREAESAHDDAVAEADELERQIREAERRRQDNSGSTPPPDTSTPPPAPGSGYQWPACGVVTSEFGWRWGRLHAGLDIDDTWSGSIVAANSGTVVFAGWNSGGYGNLTLIDHGDGVVTAYAHQAAMYVGTGQRVAKGQPIGVIGTTGNSTGTHLHFETRVNGSPINPRAMLSGGC